MFERGCGVRIENVQQLDAAAPALHVPRAAVEVLAGFPSPAQDYTTSEINLNEHLLTSPSSMYLMRVRGQSMTGAGIYDGDEIIVDKGRRAEDGDVVIAYVDGEMTVKRLRRTPDGGVILAPENPAYPNIIIPELSDLQIWGVVTTCLHHVPRG